MVRKFDREFKLEAIRMASEEGSTAVEVEQRIGRSRPWRAPETGAAPPPPCRPRPGCEDPCRRRARFHGRIHEQGVPMNHGKPLVASSCRISDPMPVCLRLGSVVGMNHPLQMKR